MSQKKKRRQKNVREELEQAIVRSLELQMLLKSIQEVVEFRDKVSDQDWAELIDFEVRTSIRLTSEEIRSVVATVRNIDPKRLRTMDLMQLLRDEGLLKMRAIPIE
ncbi:hypothetical protein [Lignipirellula cremea]|uniref:Uncharacterized protein n=1 Tax=Lignipirellula cremea TaxID=2528010 RepID=A0A518DQL4_9BACT|nr:hypothetical protein [Lignipirellula cremea]QDU94133.1 hypothetical protein Pla8534_19190 [Lignipirellula cremea]